MCSGMQFLNANEYLKGIPVYVEILKAYSSHAPNPNTHSEL